MKRKKVRRIKEVRKVETKEIMINVAGESKMVGPLCQALRREKLLRYLVKKTNRHLTRKNGFRYLSRAKRASTRLRYKGMFLSQPKALELLDRKNDTDLNLDEIQQLLNQHAKMDAPDMLSLELH